MLTYLPLKYRYGEWHFSDKILSPILTTPQCIYLGMYVFVRNGARIEGVYRYNDKEFKPRIEIGNYVTIEQNLHLTCANNITIGDYTSIAANVTITDINHSYDDISKPIERNDITVKPVSIGQECKIYNNVVILPGTTIGKHVTIGANSVVVSDIPAYSVAVGTPARVVKKYSFEKKIWIRV